MDIDNFIRFCLRRGKRKAFFRRKYHLFSYLLEVREIKKARLRLGKISFLIRDEDPHQAIIFPKIRIHFVNQIIRNRPRQVFEKIFLENRIRHPYFWTTVTIIISLLWFWILGCDFATSVLPHQNWKMTLMAPFLDAAFDLTLFSNWEGIHFSTNYGVFLSDFVNR